MAIKSTPRQIIQGPAGKLEIAITLPDYPTTKGVSLVAPPHPLHGGTLENKVVQTVAKTLAKRGYVAVRFNYRGVEASEGHWDEGRGEADDALAILSWIKTQPWGLGDQKLILAGFSFGSFVQIQVYQRLVTAEQQQTRLLLIGPAVHYFLERSVPNHTLLIHGEQDEVIPLADVLDWARPQAIPVCVFPGCSHYFHGRLVQLSQWINSFLFHS